MAKIDCSTVIGFRHEVNRACKMYEKCEDCPFTGKKKCPLDVFEYDNPDVQGIIDSLQMWSDEHPAKTRLDDVKEKHPNVEMLDGTPMFYPLRLGYCKDCDKCIVRGLIKRCWHEPLVGGATGKAVE